MYVPSYHLSVSSVCLKRFSALLNKMATRAKNRKTSKQHLPPRPMSQFQNIFTEMFVGLSVPHGVVVVVVLLFYVHGKHLRSCRDGQLT